MYGGSAKAATFINAVGIEADDIPYCADSTPEKIGKFLPGTGIEIRTEAEAIAARPDYFPGDRVELLQRTDPEGPRRRQRPFRICRTLSRGAGDRDLGGGYLRAALKVCARRATHHPVTRVGLSGSGFVIRALYPVLRACPDFEVGAVLTRRPVRLSADAFPEEILTNSIDQLVERSDIVFECSGDTEHATAVLLAAGEAGHPLVTMNAEAQVTVGSALLQRGLSITEAHGDQPGALAELHNEITAMGFEPRAYVNLKGLHDPDPTPEDMRYWAERQKITLRAVTSYTDGSKMQIEQILVANFHGATIARPGMIGGTVDDLLALDYLIEAAEEKGRPVSDYIVHPRGPKGVLILASNAFAELEPDYSVFSKVRTHGGQGYMLLKPYYFVHIEVPKTLRQVVAGAPPLITNSLKPAITIAAVAKRALPAGTLIAQALGGFELRGEALEIVGNETAVPITVLDGARTTRAIEPGEVIHAADVEMPPSRAFDLYRASIGV